MIDYMEYVRRFGVRKSKKDNQRYVGISQDVYEMLGKEANFGIAFRNEISLALMEDVMVAINKAMMNDDKDNDLKAWKKLGKVIKDVLVKHKDSDNILNDRYYQVTANPDEREFFLNNPIEQNYMTQRVASTLVDLSLFYQAMSTEVGEAVCKALVKEKKKALDELYDAKHKNGTTIYHNVISHVIAVWAKRVLDYENNSKNLKLINGSIRYARSNGK